MYKTSNKLMNDKQSEVIEHLHSTRINLVTIMSKTDFSHRRTSYFWVEIYQQPGSLYAKMKHYSNTICINYQMHTDFAKKLKYLLIKRD